MKYQVLFSLKNDKKYLRILYTAVMFGTLRVNPVALRTAKVLTVLSAVGLKYVHVFHHSVKIPKIDFSL